MRAALIVLMLAISIHAKDSVPSAVTLTCKSGEDTRILKNEHKEGGGCEVTYVKNGVSQSVASAQGETEYCDNAVTKIRATLENARFKCN